MQQVMELSSSDGFVSSENIARHQSHDELYAIYLKLLISNIPRTRQDEFRRIMMRFEPCKRVIDCLAKVMSQVNLEVQLTRLSENLSTEMPLSVDKLMDNFEASYNSFEDSLILYLVTKSFVSPQYQASFYYNTSRELAKKRYHSNPMNMCDYPILDLSYDNNILPLYEAGAYQIVAEYYCYHLYQPNIEVLKSAKRALQDCHCKQDIEGADVQEFLKQFELLLAVTKECVEYSNLTNIQTLQEEIYNYLNSSTLLELFEKFFRFGLKPFQNYQALLNSQYELILTLIDSWSQYALPNAKAALHELSEHLGKRIFRVEISDDILIKKKTAQLSLKLEQNEQPVKISPKMFPDITDLVQKIRIDFVRQLQDIGQNLNKRSVVELQKDISREAEITLKNLFNTIEYTLGSAPCAFLILGFGSYSREEMSLCSNIDFAIVVSDESCVQHAYFKYFLSMLIHLQQCLPTNVLKIKSKDLQVIFGHNQLDNIVNIRNYNIQHSKLIFKSRTRLEQLENLDYGYQQDLLRSRLRTMFSDSTAPYHQTIAQLYLVKDFRKGDVIELGGTTQNQMMNLKTTHLQPLTLWILDVGMYFGIEENNTWAMLDELNQSSRIASVFLQELSEALTYLHKLRLKLHYAWLTQSKPSGIQFDCWLEMPTDNNLATPTRDFYLDAIQRDTLDAIQRRIIEPLVETISVFGIISSPAHQFDPLIHYFEQQFKILNQKFTVGLNLKTVSTLAEIALRRPHLLTPNSTFRDLPAQVKIAYLDALEIALQTMEQENSIKGIEELKVLVQTLWHYPTEDEWRAESFRQERAWHEQLMRLVSAEVLCPASNTITLVQDKALKHYALKPEIVLQLFATQGEWQPKSRKVTGNHLVYSITDKNQTEILCWAKIYPEQPGIEWLMLHLDRRLGVYGIPCSTLVNLHHNGQNTAVLLSAHVPHPNLLTTLRTHPQMLSHLDRAHFFKTLMRVLLSNPEDDKGDDYFLEAKEDGLKLIRIDNERAFFVSEFVSGVWQVHKLQVKSILYCLDLLTEPMKTGTPSINAAIEDFLQLKPRALVKNLILELKSVQSLWQSLFSEVDIKTHYENQKPWLSLPVLYVPQELVKELPVRMESLQTLLVLNPKTTGLQLLKTVQPELAKHYTQGFEKHPNNQNPYSQICKRFEASSGQYYTVQGDNTLSLHETEVATLSLRLTGALSLDIVKAIWRGTIYAADAALKEIAYWEANHTTEVYNGLVHPDITIQTKARADWQQLPNSQRVVSFNYFSDWVRCHPDADISLQQAVLAMLPGTTFDTLDLSAFYASLDDSLLIPILKAGCDHLDKLTLNGCQNLSEAIPGVIASSCLNLKILNVSHMSWCSFSTDDRWGKRSSVSLPKVERLEMRNCENLKYFIVQTSKADVLLEGCTALNYVQFDLYPPAVNTAKGEFQYKLAESYLLGRGVSRNLTQAYYWVRLSLQQNYSDSLALFVECEYAMAKAYFLGDGVLKDFNEAYYWARLSRKHQHPLGTMLCYVLFDFYNMPSIDDTGEIIASERTILSVVTREFLTSIQTLKNPNVETLKLKNVSVPAHYLLLSLILSGNSANMLRHLSLSANNIADTEAIALAESLKINSTLRSLDLQYNCISATGTLMFAEMLKVNSTLQSLDLSLNNIDDIGVVALGEALEVNNALENLSLCFNNINVAGAVAVAEMLKMNSTLQHLDLESNNIGNAGALAFLEILRVNRTLQSLNLEHNNITDEGQETVNQIKYFLNRNKQNVQKQPPVQKPLSKPKLLETKDDSVPKTLVAFQYKPQTLSLGRPSINRTYQYEDNDIQAILVARLKQLRVQNPALIKSIEILAAVDNMTAFQLEDRLKQAVARNRLGARTLLIPCNLGNAHWVGMLFEFSTSGQILRVEYIDSLKSAAISVVPETFKKQLQAVYPMACFETRTLLQQEDYTSCGAYTIENLLIAALGISTLKEGETIRRLHLEALKKYNLSFYNAFNERQQNNRPTTASLQEQLGYLDRLKGIWFSKPELNRILAIKQCLFRLPEEIQRPLLQAFKLKSADDEHDLYLDIIRIALQEALKFESKALAELMELLFENWQPEDSLGLDKLKFRVSYNEILAVTGSHLLQNQISGLQQTLAEQIKQDEAAALQLQAELWNDGELQVSVHLLGNAAQNQADMSSEQAGTSSTASANVVVFSEINSANTNGQTLIVQAEEKQPRVLKERPKPVFKTNNGSGF